MYSEIHRGTGIVPSLHYIAMSGSHFDFILEVLHNLCKYIACIPSNGVLISLNCNILKGHKPSRPCFLDLTSDLFAFEAITWRQIVIGTDGKLCALCQEVKSEPLQCLAESKRHDLGAGYETLAENILQFEKIGGIPLALDPSPLDEGGGICTMT